MYRVRYEDTEANGAEGSFGVSDPIEHFSDALRFAEKLPENFDSVEIDETRLVKIVRA